jgi:helicase
MELDKVVGPGFDSWFLERLRLQKIGSLTKVQQLAVGDGICERASMVVCAPTSSGKTLVGEIAMLSAIRGQSRTLYLVSHKALADQKYDDFLYRYGPNGRDPIATVGLSTGDREEGDIEAQILVATYEKAMALVMTGSLDVSNTTIVADELQILGEGGRGPGVEVLCAAIRQRGPKQFVALTATVSNGNDIAGWLDCKLVHTTHRDVDLIQEIWMNNQIYSIKYGQDVGVTAKFNGTLPTTTLAAVEHLLQQKRGPVLVFTETRNDAMSLAEAYSAKRAKTAGGYKFAEQFDLFSEATEFSDKLKASTETNTAFHTADLTPSERSVVEQGLIDGSFDVCFATPTLAAGVNFPFQSVIFDRVRRRYIPPANLPLGNYRNMSGRAGRLGMHNEGYSVIIPRDNIEHQHANVLVGAENEPLYSQLMSLSVRKIVLILIASSNADDPSSIRNFLENSLYWYQIRDKNPKKLDELIAKIDEAIVWLHDHGMLVRNQEKFLATDLGAATARSGLLPSSAFQFAELLRRKATELEGDFEEYEVALLHAICISDEFNEDIGQRFFPPVARNVSSDNAIACLTGSKQLDPIDIRSQKQAVIHGVYALYLFMSGEIERRISASSGLPSGQLHRFADDVSWMLDGIHRIAAVPSVQCSQKIMNQLRIMAKRVALGVPMELIDVVKIAHRAKVPGFGRQRALSLLRAKLASTEAILAADREQLEKLLSNKERTDKLLVAIEQADGNPYERAQRLHIRAGRKLGIEALVADSYGKIGNDYEDQIEQLLRLETSWEVLKLDDGKRQGVPDFMLTFEGRSLVLECKTCTKKPPTINKEEAFAVQHKAADIANVHKLTLGKPGFDTFSESKACGSSEITLLRHADFVEAILLLKSGAVTPKLVFDWLLAPGVSEIERLGKLLD